jgi:hypothetical protein
MSAEERGSECSMRAIRTEQIPVAGSPCARFSGPRFSQHFTLYSAAAELNYIFKVGWFHEPTPSCFSQPSLTKSLINRERVL